MGNGSGFPTPPPGTGGPRDTLIGRFVDPFNDFPAGGGAEPAGTGGGVPATIQEQYLDRLAVDPAGADAFMTGFISWALGSGVVADVNDPELARQFNAWANRLDEPAGGAGRTQFASEAALDVAQANLANQRAGSEAFNRARDKWDLLQTTDALADARRRTATEALTALIPFMVDPGQEFTPGFEPGGVGPTLGNLLGANVPVQELPKMEVPLSELANPELAAPPEAISAGVESLL